MYLDLSAIFYHKVKSTKKNPIRRKALAYKERDRSFSELRYCEVPAIELLISSWYCQSENLGLPRL